MKKLLTIAILLATSACGGGVLDPVSSNKCAKSAEEYEKVLTAWSTDASNKTKCEAYRKALTDLIKDCSVYTPAQRKVYEDEIKKLTCD